MMQLGPKPPQSSRVKEMILRTSHCTGRSRQSVGVDRTASRHNGENNVFVGRKREFIKLERTTNGIICVDHPAAP